MKKLIILSLCALAFQVNAQHKTKASNWAFAPFNRPTMGNPVISPDTNSVFLDPMSGNVIKWEANDTFNPAATVKGDSIYVIYRAEDRSGKGIGERTSRLGLASSADGFKMNRRTTPVLYPDKDSQREMEWPGGCEDPRVVVTADGTYVMMYTQWNKKVPRLAVATSKDLIKWEKHGPAFAKAFEGKFADLESKSASVVTKVVNGKQVVTKVKGKYLMYWGEKFINLATSDDLINWVPDTDAKGELVTIVLPRDGYFDSALTDRGIVLLYNGKNKEGEGRDSRYTANTYAAGQVLFHKNKPGKLIGRLDQPFFVPTEAFEKSGQYPAGTVFVEGLVYFQNKWFLYYGGADSKVGGSGI